MAVSTESDRRKPAESNFWAQGDSQIYECITRHAPIIEDGLTQVGRGCFRVRQTFFVLDDVAIMRNQIRPLSLGWAVPDPEYLCFMIPLTWAGQHTINGIDVDSRHVFLLPDGAGIYVRGEARDYIGVCVRRAPFLATLAALSGADPDDFTLPESTLVLPSFAKISLVSGLMGIMKRYSDFHAGRVTAEDIQSEDIQRMRNLAIALLTDACLSAALHRDARAEETKSSISIVRSAEDCFASAEGAKISLADLCAAASVGKSRLYHAFDEVTGESPLAYFKKRRLNEARSLLLSLTPERGAVTRAALDAGLTELGRFSVQYRKLFGESPNATLRGR